VNIRMVPIDGRRDRAAESQRGIADVIQDTLMTMLAKHRMADNIQKVGIEARKRFSKENEIRIGRVSGQFMSGGMAVMLQPFGSGQPCMCRVGAKQLNFQDWSKSLCDK